MFEDMMTDRVTFVKATGEVLKTDIPALINAATKSALTEEISLPFEKGDHLLRKLPNGFVEDWIINEANYSNGIDGDMQHYALAIRRSSEQPAPQSIVVQNIQNSRVYVNSTDNSVNIVGKEIDSSALARLVQQIRPFVSAFPADDQIAISDRLNKIEIEIGKPQKSTTVISECLASLRKIGEGAAGSMLGRGLLALLDELA